MKCKEITDGEFRFDNNDEKACRWCDCGFVCYEGVLGKKLDFEERE
jgi:hypothetical protein